MRRSDGHESNPAQAGLPSNHSETTAFFAMKYDDRNIMTLDPSLEPSPRAPAAVPPNFPARAVFLCVAGALVLVFAGIWLRQWWQVGRFMEETDDAFVGGETTVIASKVPGFVVKLLVTDNQPVHAGELLAQIDDRDYRAQLARCDALVRAQESSLENLDAAAELQAAVIDEARARVEAAGAEKRRADADEIRSRNLANTRALSQQDSQKYDATAVKAAADERGSKAGLVAAQRQLTVIATHRKETEAALGQAEAERDLARLNLDFTAIRSPIDGVVGNRHARVGAYATTGSQLLSIVPAKGLWVEANFKESQLARMRPGEGAIIKADVLPGVEFRGRVESLAPASGAEFSLLPPENATGNFTKIVQRVPVRIRLEGEAARLGKLRPGLSVVARVDQR
jgi:membrane fusion protein (multidrug efflux system)